MTKTKITRVRISGGYTHSGAQGTFPSTGAYDPPPQVVGSWFVRRSVFASAVAALSVASVSIAAAVVPVLLIDVGPCHDSPPSQRTAMWVALGVASVFWLIGLPLAASCSRRVQRVLAGVAVVDVLGAISVIALYTHQVTLYYNCG